MISIATRGSLLALWQAGHVQRALTATETRLHVVRTTGDRITDVPLAQIGGRGLFTREVDDAVLSGDADCGVHSLKDVPTEPADGLVIAAILEREDPRDAWLSRDGHTTLTALPAGARVGTSALRRRALLLEQRADLDVRDVRGNLDTRLRKLHDGEYDALVLACAGLRRLGRAQEITHEMPLPQWLPAPGQGAIAVTARADDRVTIARLAQLDHIETRRAVTAERVLLRTLEGGCQVPIGAHASITNGMLTLHALVAAPDGSAILRDSITAPAHDGATAGADLARQLVDAGADAILDSIRDMQRTHPVSEP